LPEHFFKKQEGFGFNWEGFGSKRKVPGRISGVPGRRERTIGRERSAQKQIWGVPATCKGPPLI